jgi:hypothetical protein
MGTRITIKPRKQNVNVTAPAKNRIAINTGGAVGGGPIIDTIQELRDVDASDVDNNETLVYDEVSGKFIVREIPIINGGEF